MALLPRLLGSNYWDVFDFPEHIFDQHFGGGLHPSQDMFAWPLVPQVPVPRIAEHARRDAERALRAASGSSQVTNSQNEFGVRLDVRHFKPEEVKVTVQDNNLIVSGKHEERSDEHGFISREFTRRYVLPDNVISEQLSSSLSHNGVLSIKAPKKPVQPAVAGQPRSIPIQFVGGAAATANGDKQAVEDKK